MWCRPAIGDRFLSIFNMSWRLELTDGRLLELSECHRTLRRNDRNNSDLPLRGFHLNFDKIGCAGNCIACDRRGEIVKITEVKCAVIGANPIVRLVTDEGISGYGQVEAYKP